MSTSYSIFHTDGLALHFVNRVQAAAWAVSQPINSTVARLFLAFMESPFVLAPVLGEYGSVVTFAADGSVVTVAADGSVVTTADATLRMCGSWTFSVSFNSDNPNPVLGRDAIQRYADAMDYPFDKAAFTLSRLGYQVEPDLVEPDWWEDALMEYGE